MQEKSLDLSDARVTKQVKELLSLDLFSRDVIEKVFKKCRIRVFESGEALFSKGDSDKWIYFIIEGSVRVTRGPKDMLKLRRQGDIIGMMSFVDDKPRPATVKAMERTECLALDAVVMDELDINRHMDFHYIVYRIFAETLADRLRAAYDEIERLKL
jgi:CRP-like cAMP-binding protein